MSSVRLSMVPRVLSRLLRYSLLTATIGCNQAPPSSEPLVTGGVVTTGGQPETGGLVTTGGQPETGGVVTTGGQPETGGIVTTGGLLTTGGQPETGGIVTTGGLLTTGGQPETGGLVTTGGTGVDCPPSCPVHSSCVGTECQCDAGYTGLACDACDSGYNPKDDGTCVSSLCMCATTQHCVPETGACCESDCQPGAGECANGQQRRCEVDTDTAGCGQWSPWSSCNGVQCGPTACGAPSVDAVAYQWGGAGQEVAYTVASGVGGGAVVAGVAGPYAWTDSNLSDRHIFLLARDRQPNADWRREWYSGDMGGVASIARTQDNAYIAVGWAYQSLGPDDKDEGDAIIFRMDAQGNRQWTRRWGVEIYADYLEAIATDPRGNIYVGGRTFGDLTTVNLGRADLAISKLDSSGAVLWSSQWGTPDRDYIFAIGVDSQGNVYSAGSVTGDLNGDGSALGGEDAFLSKHSSEGELLWSRQWGENGQDIAYTLVIAPDDSIFVGGGTSQLGAFIYKWNPDGELQWKSDLGSSGPTIHSLAFDAAGRLYSAARTSSEIDGKAGPGQRSIHLARWRDEGTQGTRNWSAHYGTQGQDSVEALDIAENGDLLVVGHTTGAFPGYEQAGMFDAFLLRVTAPAD